jgi:hypothetical protein
MSDVGTPAYFIAAHGSEIFCTQPNKCQWTVPKGCTIVVAAHPGVTLNNDVYKHLYDKLITLPLNNIIHPDKRILFDNLGITVMIYKEGDKINSHYQYTFVDVMDKDASGLYHQNFSGLISINHAKYEYDEINQLNKKYKPSNIIQHEHIPSTSSVQLNDAKKEEIINEIAFTYRYSVYPAAEYIYKYLISIAHECPATMNFKFYLLTKLEKDPYLTITQNQLCTIDKGVYYNFICRNPKILNTNTGKLSRPSQPLYNYQYNNKNPNGSFRYPELFGHAIPRYNSVLSLTPNRKRIVKEGLEEMLGRRSIMNAQNYAAKSAARHESLFRTPTKPPRPSRNRITHKKSSTRPIQLSARPIQPLSLTPKKNTRIKPL